VTTEEGTKKGVSGLAVSFPLDRATPEAEIARVERRLMVDAWDDMIGNAVDDHGHPLQ
jgi:hypothetical protein